MDQPIQRTASQHVHSQTHHAAKDDPSSILIDRLDTDPAQDQHQKEISALKTIETPKKRGSKGLLDVATDS